jgi:hypothetical protein
MPQCAGIKRSGGRCTVVVALGETYCYHHSPERAPERKRNAARGGRSKGATARKEVQTVRDQVRTIIAGVIGGRLERGAASTAIQGYNVLLRAVEVERRLREQEELVERLERIEDHLEQRRRGFLYGN